MPRVLVPAVAVALALVMVVAGPAPAAPQPTPAAPVSPADTTLAPARPAVAMDADGDTAVAWVSRAGGQQQVWLAVRPAGGAFGAPAALGDPSPSASGPALAYDAQGNLLALWTQAEVESAVFPADGGPVTRRTLGPGSFPRLAVDGQGGAVAAWVASDGAHVRVVAVTRPPGGAFGAPEYLSDAGATAGDPRLAVAPDGTAAVVWRRFDGAVDRAQVRIRPPGGAFGAVETLSEATYAAAIPAVGIDAAGNVLAAWLRSDGAHLRVETRFRPAGGAFQPMVRVSDSGLSAQSLDLAMSAGGDAVVTWTRKFRVEAAVRPAGGAAFQPTVRISALDANSYAPDVGIDAAGNAVVTWPYETVGGQVYPAVSVRPPGGGFGAPAPLADPVIWQQHTGLAVDGQGNAAAVWIRLADGATQVSDPLPGRVEVAGLDGAAPVLRSVTVPGTGTVGSPVSVSVDAVDTWSGPVTVSWDFGDGASGSGGQAAHTYSAPGTYPVTVTATDARGQATSRTVAVSVSVPVSGAGTDTTSPRITRLRVAPTRFAAAPRSRGAVVRFTVSEAAVVRLTVQRPDPGRRVDGRCRPPQRAASEAPRCTRWAAVRGSLVRDVGAGAARVRFEGRLGSRWLAPGRYRLVARATDAAGNASAPARAAFIVVRR